MNASTSQLLGLVAIQYAREVLGVNESGTTLDPWNTGHSINWNSEANKSATTAFTTAVSSANPALPDAALPNSATSPMETPAEGGKSVLVTLLLSLIVVVTIVGKKV